MSGKLRQELEKLLGEQDGCNSRLKRMRQRLAAAEEDDNEELIKTLVNMTATTEAEFRKREKVIETVREEIAAIEAGGVSTSVPSRATAVQPDMEESKPSVAVEGSVPSGTAVLGTTSAPVPRGDSGESRKRSRVSPEQGEDLEDDAIKRVRAADRMCEVNQVRSFIVPLLSAQGGSPQGTWEVELVQRSYFDKVLLFVEKNAEWIAWSPYQWPIFLRRRIVTPSNFYGYLEKKYRSQLPAEPVEWSEFIQPLLVEIKVFLDGIYTVLTLSDPNLMHQTPGATDAQHSSAGSGSREAQLDASDLVPLIRLLESTLLRLAVFVYHSYATKAKPLASNDQLLRGECHLAPWLYVEFSRGSH
jgi:hypothetical protein